MKMLIPFLLLAATFTACRKDKTEPLLTVEVYDYISGQPLEGVEVGRSTLSNWSWQCLCYTNTNVSNLGYTGPDGKLNGLLSFESIFVQKDKYITGGKNRYCLSSGNDYSLRLELFRFGMFEITHLPRQSYTDPVWLEIYPLLKTGRIPKPYYVDEFYLTPGTVFKPFGYAGMTNRLIVLKRSSSGSIPDTLAKTDIFLPEHTTQQVTLNY